MQQAVVPDYWGFDGSNPCLRHGGYYNQNQGYGPFYVYCYGTSYQDDSIGCRILAKPQAILHLVVRVPHPFYIARLTAQHLLKKSQQDTA